jgi:hypothetical protein
MAAELVCIMRCMWSTTHPQKTLHAARVVCCEYALSEPQVTKIDEIAWRIVRMWRTCGEFPMMGTGKMTQRAYQQCLWVWGQGGAVRVQSLPWGYTISWGAALGVYGIWHIYLHNLLSHNVACHETP